MAMVKLWWPLYESEPPPSFFWGVTKSRKFTQKLNTSTDHQNKQTNRQI
jgi:hypothetical protein